ncbi:helix-turn-helix domain-containing protein [Streptomyces sp. NPDC048290]|uniref:helix-turn-helix domain-containing protein n=1 Tax=Streptomyces sp. NPDC048290 TaxID=3155811 RepID=UPI00342AA394
MAGKRKRLAQRRKMCGYTQEGFAEALCVDRSTVQRWERGEADPQPHQRPKMARLLGVEPEGLELILAPDIAVAPEPALSREERGEDLAFAIREMSRHLVALDNAMNGVPIAEVAARSFKKVHRRLGEAAYDRRSERDVQAAAAELAEVAGWALFDAEEQSAARRFNQEALFLARLSGDRSIELLIMQNIAMQAGHVGRPREEVAIARAVIEQGGLSPRTEAIFRVREARGLSASARETEAARYFARARSLIQDSGREDDPAWAWWFTSEEIDGHQGCALRRSGQAGKGIPFLQRAVRQEEGAQAGYRYISGVQLLACYVEVEAWGDAEELARALIPVVGEMSSARALGFLNRTTCRGKALSRAPSGLRDALEHIESTIGEDPYGI